MPSPFLPPTTIHIADVKDIPEDQISRYEHANAWNCCLCHEQTDSRLLRFLFIHIVMILLMGFCAMGIHRADSCEGQQTYIALLTMLIGIYLPQPK